MFDAQVPKDHNPTATFFFWNFTYRLQVSVDSALFFLFIVGLLLAIYYLLASLSGGEEKIVGGWIDGLMEM